MFIELRLTRQEVATLVELLETEARQLYAEEWHTDSRDLKRELNNRLRTMDRLAERLRNALTGEGEDATATAPAPAGNAAEALPA